MKFFLKRLFRRENVVTLLLVVTAVLAIFELPQKVGLNEIQIILIMLGFLAVDALIEKLGYLEGIETSTKTIENIIVPYPNSVVLRHRRDLLPFSQRVEGKRDVFVFAISANSLLSQNSRAIQNALTKGTNFRFLLVSPDNPSLEAASHSSPSAASVETQVQWIQHSVEMLRHISQDNTKGKLELRYFSGIPTTSLIAYDADTDNGSIQVEPHAFRQTPADRPLFNLQLQSKNEWYSYYKEVIEDLWDTSTPISL